MIRGSGEKADYLHLFNTHLQASYSGAKYVKDNHNEFEARLNQVTELAEFIHSKIHTSLNSNNQVKSPGEERHSFVVAGDLNIRANCCFHPTMDVVPWKISHIGAE